MHFLKFDSINRCYCHTRPRGKTYHIPKGSKDGPKSGIIFISDQPATQPDNRTAYLLNIFKLEYRIYPWLDLTLLNLSVGDQTKIENYLK